MIRVHVSRTVTIHFFLYAATNVGFLGTYLTTRIVWLHLFIHILVFYDSTSLCIFSKGGFELDYDINLLMAGLGTFKANFLLRTQLGLIPTWLQSGK